LVSGIIGSSQMEAQTPSSGLRIVVIDGEDAVNVVQQQTAAAPVVEVRDRNNQPVSGVVVKFAIRSGRAMFSGARSLAVTIAQTNVMTAAQAATTPAAAGGTGGGLSPTTLAAIGAAAAGGAVAAKKLSAIGGRTYTGQFSGTLPMAFATCTRFEQQTGTLTHTVTLQ
jgi:hypothetical protein